MADAPSGPAPSRSDAAARRPLACLLCSQRKIRCDRREPCSNCTRSRVECVAATPVHPRARKKRFPEAELLARLKRYEAALVKYGIDVDTLNEPAALTTKPPKLNTDVAAVRQAGGKDGFAHAREMLEASSDDDQDASPISKTWDSIHEDNARLLLLPPSVTSLRPFHPDPVHLFRLWQIFLENINPLSKIVHVPSLQVQILDASTKLDQLDKGLEVLMFAIYLAAVMSLEDESCLSIFGESRNDLVGRYQFATQQGLVRASFFKTTDLRVVQALTLYIMMARINVDPRALFNVSGMLVRTAQRLTLHIDGTAQKRSVFDTEMRRRLWWQIVLLDHRIAEFSGAGTAIITHKWTTRLPLNVNDCDLDPSMRDPPVEHRGATEMLFCLTRCEIAAFLGTMRAQGPFDGSWFEMNTTNVPQATRETEITRLEEKLDQKYLTSCDPQIPLHHLVTATVSATIYKLRLLAHHPLLREDRGVGMAPRTKDLLCKWCCIMIEEHTPLMQLPSLQRFSWFINTTVPMDAHLYLLSDLRHRTHGELADRAWTALSDVSDAWELSQSATHMRRIRSAMHLALSRLALKSWERRDASYQQHPPAFIERARALFAEQKRAAASDPSSATTSPPASCEQVTAQLSQAHLHPPAAAATWPTALGESPGADLAEPMSIDSIFSLTAGGDDFTSHAAEWAPWQTYVTEHFDLGDGLGGPAMTTPPSHPAPVPENHLAGQGYVPPSQNLLWYSNIGFSDMPGDKFPKPPTP